VGVVAVSLRYSSSPGSAPSRDRDDETR